MANVMFKRGQSTALPKGNNIVDGAFYLTEDTNHLYVGKQDAQGNKSLAKINGNIHAVPSLPTTPGEAGEFYYILGQNILAYYDSTLVKDNETGATNPIGWVQLNPDTYYDTYVNADKTEFETSTVYLKNGVEVTDKDLEGKTSEEQQEYLKDAEKVIKITYNLYQTIVDHNGQVLDGDKAIHYAGTDPISKSFYITENDFNAVIDGAEVSIKAETGTINIPDVGQKSTINLSTDGVGSDSEKVIKLLGNEIGLTLKDDVLTLSGHVYNMDYTTKDTDDKVTYNNRIDFSQDGTITNSINFLANDSTKDKENDDLEVTANEDGIIYSHKTYEDLEDTGIIDGEISAANRTFKVVSDITATNGHITGVETATYTLPEDKNDQFSIHNIITNNTGGIEIQFAKNDTYQSNISKTVEADLIYFKDGEQKIYNKADLGITKKINDALAGFKELDALVYKGAVAYVTDDEEPDKDSEYYYNLPTQNVRIGDTYKTSTKGTYNSINVDIGDLFIATGTEGTDGYIGNDLEWTYIPSGADTDTTYTYDLANNTFTINGTDGSNYQLKFGHDTSVTNSDIVISTDTTNNTLNIDHKGYTAHTAPTVTTGATQAGQEITIIKNVTTTNGHVTGITTDKFTLPGDKDSTYTLGLTKDKPEIVLTGDGTAAGYTGTVTFKTGTANDSLTVAGADTNITYSHKDFNYSNPTTPVTTGATQAKDQLTVVTGATVDNGHITGLTTGTLILPDDKDSTYALEDIDIVAKTLTVGAVEYKGIETKGQLTGAGTATGADSNNNIAVLSSSLNVFKIQDEDTKNSTPAAYGIDLVWGSF